MVPECRPSITLQGILETVSYWSAVGRDGELTYFLRRVLFLL